MPWLSSAMVAIEPTAQREDRADQRSSMANSEPNASSRMIAAATTADQLRGALARSWFTAWDGLSAQLDLEPGGARAGLGPSL